MIKNMIRNHIKERERERERERVREKVTVLPQERRVWVECVPLPPSSYSFDWVLKKMIWIHCYWKCVCHYMAVEKGTNEGRRGRIELLHMIGRIPIFSTQITEHKSQSTKSRDILLHINTLLKKT